MNANRPTYAELVARLAAVEPIVEALRHHEVDAVVGQEKLAILLLREVQEALLASDAGFRAMFELPGVAMVQADSPSFRFTRVNQKFCETSGYASEELLTKTLIGLTDPRDRQRAMKELARVLRGGADSWFIENRCIRKDGRVIWVEINGAAVRNESGGVVRVMAMVRDITAQRGKPKGLKKGTMGNTGKPAVKKPSGKRRLKK